MDIEVTGMGMGLGNMEITNETICEEGTVIENKCNRNWKIEKKKKKLETVF